MMATGDGSLGHPQLNVLNQQAVEMLTVFGGLPAEHQMDGLDILQNVVNKVIHTITNGRVSSVKFVPVESTCSTVDAHQELLNPLLPPKMEIKKEPVDGGNDEDCGDEPDLPMETSYQVFASQADALVLHYPPSSLPSFALAEPSLNCINADTLAQHQEISITNDANEDHLNLAKGKHPRLGKRANKQQRDKLLTKKQGTAARAESLEHTTPRSQSLRGKRTAQNSKTNNKDPRAKNIASKSRSTSSQSDSSKIASSIVEEDGMSDSPKEEPLDSTPLPAESILESLPISMRTPHRGKHIMEEAECILESLPISMRTPHRGKHIMEEAESILESLPISMRTPHRGKHIMEEVDIKDKEKVLLLIPPKLRARVPGYHRKKGGQLQCEECSYSTGKRSHLKSHMTTHTGLSRYECDQCGRHFTVNSSLKRHMMAHEGIRPHACPVCSKSFIDIASLRTHSVVHTGERLYKCDQCAKMYTNSANLSRHKRVHTGEMPYCCKDCDARFRDMSSLKLHVLKHTGEKPYLCEVCNKQFRTSSEFRRHERVHTGERKYRCKQCGKKFLQGYHLKQHERMHADLRPWQCELCNKRFRTKASWQHHEKSHAGVKDFQCSICSKCFTTKKYLECHQVVHTQAKPYKCKVCGQDFNQISNMKRHERIHSSALLYTCRHCGKGFKYINSLQYHEGIHTGAGFTCEKCGLSFRSKYGIRGHRCRPSLLVDSDDVDELDIKQEDGEDGQQASTDSQPDTKAEKHQKDLGQSSSLGSPSDNLCGPKCKRNVSHRSKSAMLKSGAMSSEKSHKSVSKVLKIKLKTCGPGKACKKNSCTVKQWRVEEDSIPVVAKASRTTKRKTRTPVKRASRAKGTLLQKDPVVPYATELALLANGSAESQMCDRLIKEEPAELDLPCDPNTVATTERDGDLSDEDKDILSSNAPLQSSSENGEKRTVAIAVEGRAGSLSGLLNVEGRAGSLSGLLNVEGRAGSLSGLLNGRLSKLEVAGKDVNVEVSPEVTGKEASSCSSDVSAMRQAYNTSPQHPNNAASP